MRQLVVIRHALAHCNVDGTVGGPLTCQGLHPDGKQQAGQLPARLAALLAQPPKAILVSPRRRAGETAAPLGEWFGMPLQVADELREPDCGAAADGRAWVEVMADATGVDREDPTVPLIEGGERWADHVARVTGALRLALAAHDDGPVVVVGHAETVAAAFYLFLGLDPTSRPGMKFAADNACATIWTAASGTPGPPTRAWTLAAHNLPLGG